MLLSPNTMSNYIICARNQKGESFGSEPGKVYYIILGDAESDPKADHIVSEKDFLSSLTSPAELRDVVIFVHGTDYTIGEVLDRHKQIKSNLQQQGYAGELISFDWPSNGMPLLYLDDRHDAKVTAMGLVKSGITLLAKQQGRGCILNVHAMAHSSGAYIIQESFNDSETTRSTAEVNWTLSQLILFGGDVSSDSMSATRGESVYRHCNRLTNYYNPHDAVLAISNAKRAGFKNRVGRIGLPSDVPQKAVDVHCGDYYKAHGVNLEIRKGKPSHAWYFYSDVWWKDVYETLMGDDDRNVIASRVLRDGKLFIQEV